MEVCLALPSWCFLSAPGECSHAGLKVAQLEPNGEQKSDVKAMCLYSPSNACIITCYMYAQGWCLSFICSSNSVAEIIPHC